MADVSKMKLYEEGRVKGIASALRRKLKDYYTYPADNSLDTSATAKKFYEGTYTLADLGPYEGSDGEIKDTRTKTSDGKSYENFGVNNLPTRLGFPSTVAADKIALPGSQSSGYTYTAPDNGWLCASLGNSNQWSAQAQNLTSGIVVRGDNIYYSGSRFSGHSPRYRELAITLPCARYDKVKVTFTGFNSNQFFFVKAIETNKCEYNTDGTPKAYSTYKHLAMPVVSYAGAKIVSISSGGSYVAPSDGWIMWGNTSTDNHYCVLYNNNNAMKATASNDLGMVRTCILPVAKGTSIKCTFNGGQIRFLAAYGEDL